MRSVNLTFVVFLWLPEERTMAWQLLSYQEDSVGRLMNPEFIAVRGEMKVSDAFDFIRWTVRNPEELHSHLFVVDATGALYSKVRHAAQFGCIS